MDNLHVILKKFAEACYWHGENTGDYDMVDIENENFYKETIKEIEALNEKH